MTKILERIDEKQIHKTPRGEAIWPKLIIPETKFDPAGVYEIRMKFGPDAEKEFLATMTELFELAYEQTRQHHAKTLLPRELPPWKSGKDGRLEFKFKLKASGVFDGQPWTNKPPKLFDSRGRRIDNPDPQKLRIGTGSEVRTFFQVRPYFVQKAGITLRLKAVQILKLVEYDDAQYFGILQEENEDGGFVHEEPAMTAAPRGDYRAPIEHELAADENTPQPEVRITDDDIPF